MDVENQERSPKRQSLFEAAREAAQEPGVYLMKDPAGVVLYVGKAKNLKNRLTSYFQGIVHEHPRTEMLVQTADVFDVIITETEAEALILECTLIKKYKPRFNIRLKDDKAYPYIKVNFKSDFPKLEWTRKVKRDGAKYFGPFPSAWSARQVMRLLIESFQLRDCSDNTFSHRSRPCILYQIGKCTAPCVKIVSQEDYKEQVRDAVKVLEGKSTSFVKNLRKQMELAAAEDDFERAALIRDQMQAIELVTATQTVDEAGSRRHRDVIAIARQENSAHLVVLQVRDGKLLSVKHFDLQNVDSTLETSEVLSDAMAQHYQALQQQVGESNDENAPALPQEILIGHAINDQELLEKTLGFEISEPKNDRERQLAQVAQTNADYGLKQSMARTQGHGVKAREEVMEKLNMTRLPHRIECYDNSNFQGTESVASRVVFTDGAPDKNLYRRYKIHTVEGSNDFATMREVLGRRFSSTSETELPDLVVVDGGKGQLSQAVAIMEELGVQGVAVVGLAKARTESDFQSSDVKSSHERVFLPNRKNPVVLFQHMAAYKLLTHVRDEAHRFAISYHRLLRSKRTFKSEE